METQAQLSELLLSAGFENTQVTISRDILELRLVKVNTRNRLKVYMQLDTQDSIKNKRDLLNNASQIFKEYMVSVNSSQNIIVVKTLPGMAMAVGTSIDKMNEINILGTVAGDDTVFCVISDNNSIDKIVHKLRSIITGIHK